MRLPRLDYPVMVSQSTQTCPVQQQGDLGWMALPDPPSGCTLLRLMSPELIVQLVPAKERRFMMMRTCWYARHVLGRSLKNTDVDLLLGKRFVEQTEEDFDAMLRFMRDLARQYRVRSFHINMSGPTLPKGTEQGFIKRVNRLIVAEATSGRPTQILTCHGLKRPHSVTSLLAVLRGCTDLRELFLPSNAVGDDNNCDALVTVLSGFSKLEKLSLFQCRLRAQGVVSVGSALAHLTSLVELDIAGNIDRKDEPSSERAMGKALAQASRNLTKLVKLSLFSNRLGEGAKDVMATLQALPSLRDVNLGFTGLGAWGGTALADAMRNLTSLTKLQVGSCSLGADGGNRVSLALSQLVRLKLLDLSFNKIGGVAGCNLAKSVQGLSELETLDLSMNSFHYEALRDLQGAMMHSLPVLKHVDVTNNADDQQVRDLYKALRKKRPALMIRFQ